jgi:hypothetical protein
MITLHVFTEEVSSKNVFDVILPKILSENVSFRIYPHQGKQDLEKALRTSLPSISKLPGSKILITRDQDNANCRDVKDRIQEIIGENCHCEYLIRIACKELEAWFLGDLEALKKAYPRFKPEQYQSKADFRNVDKITDPDKYLLRIIPEFNYKESLPKLVISETIAPFLDLKKNNSSSFKNTISAIKKLVGS